MAFPELFPRRAIPTAVLVILLAALFLAACAPAATPQPTLAPSATPVPPSETPRPSATSTATPTMLPSATPLPSSTPIPSPTLSPTPAAAFSQMQIISISNGIGGVSVIFKLPGVQTAYAVKIRSYPYSCVLDTKTPDRLYCTGLATPPFDLPLDIVFSDPQTKQVVYSGSTVYSAALLVTATVQGWGKNDCAARGTNVSCETECRLLPNGNPCVVSTCSDACGLYFSVDTCPADMSMDFPSCPPELFAQMKALYSIP